MKKNEKPPKILSVQEKDVGLRLDVYLSQTMEISRSSAARLIDMNCNGTLGVRPLHVNAKPIKASHKVELGESYSVLIPEPVAAHTIAQDIELDIIYEDDTLLVINKPRGLVVHPAPGHNNGTLVNALLHHCGDSLTGVGGVMRPGIVHRLDKDTSGLMIVAKTQTAHEKLSAALKARNITRIYHALCVGNVKNNRGTINAPIGRHPVKRKQQAVTPNGRDAVTHYEVIERLPKQTLVKCELETGRTHQIRVHMAHIGHPIVGDPLYSTGKLGRNTQMLHSIELGFIHPVTGEGMYFKVPPLDF